MLSKINLFGFQIAIFLAYLIFQGYSLPIKAKSIDQVNKDYKAFFSDFENIFLYRPYLVKEVFFGIITLKGDKTLATKRINRDVLGCHTESIINPGCRIDNLIIQRKKSGISKYFTIPVSFSRISSRRYNKYKKIITLRWIPELFPPPLIPVNTFLEYINTAKNSKYFQIKNELEFIQLNPAFTEKIEIVVENALAKNLIQLYQKPRKDKKDYITYIFDYVNFIQRYQTKDFFIHLKAVKVKINQQIFGTLVQ